MQSPERVGNIDNNLLDLSEAILIKTLLSGSNSFHTNVLNATIEYVLSTKRSEELLFKYIYISIHISIYVYMYI